MSRIHEALKKAEQDRTANAAEAAARPVEPAGVAAVRHAAAVLPAEAILPPSGLGRPWKSPDYLRLDDLRQRCARSHWKLDPDAIVFCNPAQSRLGAEQFRTLRSRLYRLREKQTLRTLLITSALRGEGKSFVAANLAQAIVRQHERRALLIDADLRSSRLHLPLGAPSAPGLSDYLRGDADEFSIIQSDSVSEDNLFFIPGGKPVSNPAEILANPRLKSLLDRLAPVFDWIVLDSPPALPISDASVLGALCDGVLFVVRAGSTRFDLAQRACQEFREKNLIGAVLNDAEASATYAAYSYYAGAGTDKR